jgi:4-amino-4-deoxy-L-arabinose transferase-like glycosyltransferase
MPGTAAPPRLVLLRDKVLRRFGKGGVLLLAVLAALFVGAVAYTLEGEKPWGRTVQKRMQKHEALKPQEHAVIGLWWAALINAGLLAVLIGTAGKWLPRVESDDSGAEKTQAGLKISEASPAYLPKRWIWPLVLAAVLAGAWERWPKLTQSLWNDEAYALNRFMHGVWDEQKDGTMAFEPVTWTATLFENRNGNNHLLNSLVSRVSLQAWRSITGSPREAFNEVAVRLPHFLAGLGTIVLVFLLGREMSSPLIGVAAAWLMAVHPWHIRYAVEARGYSFMLCFVALALLGLVMALRTNRLRWWLAFSLGEALFLLSFPGSLYVAAAMNGLCVIELALRREWAMTGRLVAFNTLAAVPVLQWVLPSVPQILNWLKEHLPEYVTDVWQWLYDLASVLAFGWQYDNPLREAHVGTDWKGVIADFWVIGGYHVPPAVIVVLLTAPFIVGVVLAFRSGTAARLIVFAPVLAALGSIAVNLRPGTPMTVWYLISLLIPVTLAVPLTLVRICQGSTLRWLPFAICVWFVYRYTMGTGTAVEALREHDRQPMRQSVAYIRAQAPDALTATFGVSDRQHSAYDGQVKVLESSADLEEWIARSRAASQPLYVYYCSDYHGERRRPEIHARITKSGEFEKLKEFPGSEELFSYRVYRLK